MTQEVWEKYTIISGWPFIGPHQPRCAVLQLDAQAIHFSAHKTVHA